MLKKITLLLVTSSLVIACSSDKPDIKQVKAMQAKDKNLSCKELLLEMNEADFYREMAHKNKGPKLQSMLMPLGYVSTYMEAEKAIDAAEARVAYLDRIYEILRCEDKDQAKSKDKDSDDDLPVYKGEPHSSNEYEDDEGGTKYEFSGIRYYTPY